MPDDAKSWLPTISRTGAAQPVVDPVIYQPMTAKVTTPVVVKLEPPTSPPQPKAPRGWRFVPERDENNLIVEIVATPIL